MGEAAESIGRALPRRFSIIMQSKDLEIQEMRIGMPGVSV